MATWYEESTLGKEPDAGKDWGQESRGWQDEMVGWHHWLNGHELEQTPGNSEGHSEAGCAAVHGVANQSRHYLATEQQQIYMHMRVCIFSRFSHVWLSATLWTEARLLCWWDFPCKNAGVGCHVLLRRSSWPRDGTWVFGVAGRFFTCWAIWKANMGFRYMYTHTYMKQIDCDFRLWI